MLPRAMRSGPRRKLSRTAPGTGPSPERAPARGAGVGRKEGRSGEMVSEVGGTRKGPAEPVMNLNFPARRSPWGSQTSSPPAPTLPPVSAACKDSRRSAARAIMTATPTSLCRAASKLPGRFGDTQSTRPA